MAKSILMIHGRNFKPAAAVLQKQWLEALRFGIARDHAKATARFDAAHKELVYYGDFSNAFLSKVFNQPIPDDSQGRQQTLDALKQYKKADFKKSVYNKLPGKSAAKEVLADTFGGFLAAIRLSNPVIEAVAPDLREYWNEDSEFGTNLRFPMIAPLKKAMDNDDEILVISHSLGTMIAYDTFWKFCRLGEYRPQYTNKKISLWITLGSPLGDETVKRSLKGAKLPMDRRYPDNVVNWLNVSAEDDFVSHDESLADDYASMKALGNVKSIKDKHIFNLSVRDGKSNPHHEAGYLIHPVVAESVAAWL
jgi:hypothetical protein